MIILDSHNLLPPPTHMRILKYIGILILSLALAFIAFLGIITLMDYRPEPTETCKTSGTASQISSNDSVFSLVTWNLGYFGLGMKNDFFFDGGRMTRPDKAYYEQCSQKALNHISGLKETDFFLFQEVDLDSKRSHHDDQVHRITQQLPGYEYAIAVNYKVIYVPVPVTNPMGKVNSVLLTLSKYQSAEITRFAFPGGFAWPQGLFMLDRCFLLTRIPLSSGKDLVLINTHNEAFDDGSLRKQQMEVLRKTMVREYEKGNYVITGGDWNLNPIGYDPAILRTGDAGKFIEPLIEQDFMPDGWQWSFDPDIPTNRNVDQPYRRGMTPVTIIDFFIVSPNVAVLEIKTGDLLFQWSDHQPVRMKILLKQVIRP